MSNYENSLAIYDEQFLSIFSEGGVVETFQIAAVETFKVALSTASEYS